MSDQTRSNQLSSKPSRLLEYDTGARNNGLRGRRARRIGNHGDNNTLSLELLGDRNGDSRLIPSPRPSRTPARDVDRHANISDAVEEDGVVLAAGREPGLVLGVGEVQADAGPGEQGRGAGGGAERGEVLARGRVLGVGGGAAAGHDEGPRRVEDLVGVGEHGVGGAGERVGAPDRDQAPDLVAGLGLGDGGHGARRARQPHLLHQPRQERHRRDLEHRHERQERRRVVVREPVGARARLDRPRRDLVLEEPQVARLVVADLLHPPVRRVGEPRLREDARVELLDRLLVEVEDHPCGVSRR